MWLARSRMMGRRKVSDLIFSTVGRSGTLDLALF
jgi:hypothetical protein